MDTLREFNPDYYREHISGFGEPGYTVPAYLAENRFRNYLKPLGRQKLELMQTEGANIFLRNDLRASTLKTFKDCKHAGRGNPFSEPKEKIGFQLKPYRKGWSSKVTEGPKLVSVNLRKSRRDCIGKRTKKT
jgi:hypothetical protein